MVVALGSVATTFSPHLILKYLTCLPPVIVTKISFVTLPFDIQCSPAYPVIMDVTESVKYEPEECAWCKGTRNARYSETCQVCKGKGAASVKREADFQFGEIDQSKD